MHRTELHTRPLRKRFHTQNAEAHYCAFVCVRMCELVGSIYFFSDNVFRVICAIELRATVGLWSSDALLFCTCVAVRKVES